VTSPGRGEPGLARVGPDLILCRLVLGGLFLLAAGLKLSDPQAFAGAVKAFRIVPLDTVPYVTFAIPWSETVFGLALVLGFWSRSAALGLGILLLGFITGMGVVLARGEVVECGCFGKFFGSRVGPESILRNVVFLALAAPVALRGGGALSLDRVLGARRRGGSAGATPAAG
jgi:uncharacterized membrane protein YphA (DoxX/SURF4 family)